MKFLKKALLGLATTTVALIAMSQSVTAMTITATGMKYDHPTYDYPTQVTIHAPSKDQRVQAGGFNVTDGSESFLAWCVDIFQPITFGSPVDDYSTGNATTFGQAKVNALGRLATEALSQVSNSKTSGAFQLAVWEIVNETSGVYDLTKGTFKVDNVSDRSKGLAQYWLNHLPTTSTYSVDLLVSPTHQDLAEFEKASVVPPASVPEPATTALLGLGLLGFAASRRKSANSKNA